MSDVNDSNNGINATPQKSLSLNSVIIGGLIFLCAVLVLALIVLSSKNLDWKSEEIFNWVYFSLLATALSGVFSLITISLSQKLEENKEKNRMNKIDALFVKKIGEISSTFIGKTDEIAGTLNTKTDEITDSINIALERSDLACGNQDTILRMLMDRSLVIGKIERIRILAHNSDSFSDPFKDYFSKNEDEFECPVLDILIHNQAVNKDSKVIKDWCSLYEKKKIYKLEIRKTKEIRRSFFGMIIGFESHRRIGLIGFYEPQDEVKPYKRYGVFSEDGSILDVLDLYFNYYFVDNYSTLVVPVKEKPGIKENTV